MYSIHYSIHSLRDVVGIAAVAGWWSPLFRPLGLPSHQHVTGWIIGIMGLYIYYPYIHALYMYSISSRAVGGWRPGAIIGLPIPIGGKGPIWGQLVFGPWGSHSPVRCSRYGFIPFLYPVALIGLIRPMACQPAARDGMDIGIMGLSYIHALLSQPGHPISRNGCK